MKAISRRLLDIDGFSEDQYVGINNDELMCFGIDYLSEQNVPATFENVTVVLFKLFPRDFSLVGFPEYPDAARVNRTLLHGRPKYRNLVLGNAKSGYSLTKKGHYIARQAAADLSDGRKRQGKQPETDDSKRTFKGTETVRQVESATLYEKWRDGRLDQIGNYEIWDFLEAVPYTDKDVLNDIYKSYRTAAQAAGREDILDFLAWVSKRYSHIFKG